jgi:mono/diheme cytochrome c family protein
MKTYSLPKSFARSVTHWLKDVRRFHLFWVSGAGSILFLALITSAFPTTQSGHAQISHAGSDPKSSVAIDISSGQRLFALYGCSECHLSKGQGARSTGVRLGPPSMDAEDFISYVREPTGEMPPYTQKVVADKELADMYAFLQTVPKTPSWKTIPLLNQ